MESGLERGSVMGEIMEIGWPWVWVGRGWGVYGVSSSSIPPIQHTLQSVRGGGRERGKVGERRERAGGGGGRERQEWEGEGGREGEERGRGGRKNRKGQDVGGGGGGGGGGEER